MRHISQDKVCNGKHSDFKGEKEKKLKLVIKLHGLQGSVLKYYPIYIEKQLEKNELDSR